jgi:hypothetical protein
MMTAKMQACDPAVHRSNRAIHAGFGATVRSVSVVVAKRILSDLEASEHDKAVGLLILREPGTMSRIAELLASEPTIVAVEPTEPAPGAGWCYDVPSAVVESAMQSIWPMLAKVLE